MLFTIVMNTDALTPHHTNELGTPSHRGHCLRLSSGLVSVGVGEQIVVVGNRNVGSGDHFSWETKICFNKDELGRDYNMNNVYFNFN